MLAAFLLREPDWENLSGLLRDTVSPECCLAEVSNAITKATRRELITRNDARLKFQALLKLMEGNLRLARDADLLQLAFEMALGKAKLPVYDYLFIALAKMRSLPLYTRDKVQHGEALRQQVPSTIV